MDITDILPVLFTVLVLLGFVAAVGGVVYLVLHLRSGERFSFSMRLLFRLYLYVISLISLVILVVGAATLVQAGLGAALGKEFSYFPIYAGGVAFPEQIPLEPDGRATEEAVDEAARQAEEQEQQRERGLDRALQEGILNGISLTLVGAAVWGLHACGRRRLETEDERQGVLSRGYLILLLVIFGVITLVTLPSAIFQTSRYFILEPLDGFSRDRPGGTLAAAIASLPVWAYYLRATLNLLRLRAPQEPEAS